MNNTDVPGVFKRKETIYKPSHYAKKPIETIDFIEQTVADYNPVEAVSIANTIKYIARAPHKGSKEDDLIKARNYLNRAITGEWEHET